MVRERDGSGPIGSGERDRGIEGPFSSLWKYGRLHACGSKRHLGRIKWHGSSNV